MIMTKQEVMSEAQQYANVVQAPVYVYRRGDNYEGSQLDPVHFRNGWRLAEMVYPAAAVKASEPPVESSLVVYGVQWKRHGLLWERLDSNLFTTKSRAAAAIEERRVKYPNTEYRVKSYPVF